MERHVLQNTCETLDGLTITIKMNSIDFQVWIMMQTLILGDKMAFVNSVTLMLRRWQTFCAAGGGETRAVILERVVRQCVREEVIVVCLCQWAYLCHQAWMPDQSDAPSWKSCCPAGAQQKSPSTDLTNTQRESLWVPAHELNQAPTNLLIFFLKKTTTKQNKKPQPQPETVSTDKHKFSHYHVWMKAYKVPILSSSGMLMILKASVVSVNRSLSCRPGMVMFPLDRKRYLLKSSKHNSATTKKREKP